MIIDQTRIVQWIPEDPATHLTVLSPDISTNQIKLIHSGVAGEELVEALLNIGVVYNYDPANELPLETSNIMYSSKDQELPIIILSAVMDIENIQSLKFLSYTNNALRLNPDKKTPVNAIFKFEVMDGVIVPIPMPEDEFNNTGTCGGIQAILTLAVEESAGPDIILITNGTEDNNGALIGLPSVGIFEIRGPAGGITVADNVATLCLSPARKPEKRIVQQTTDCFDLEGQVAIEINGELVPYYFDAKDLPVFFNSSNPYGIEFLPCTIQCIPTSAEILTRPNIEGGWRLDYSFDDGEIFRWEQIDMPATYYRSLFSSAIKNIFNSGNAGLATCVGGNGGSGNFYSLYSNIIGAEGGPDDPTVKLSFHRITEPFEGVDLFMHFFGTPDVGDRIDVQSCGIGSWPGV